MIGWLIEVFAVLTDKLNDWLQQKGSSKCWQDMFSTIFFKGIIAGKINVNADSRISETNCSWLILGFNTYQQLCLIKRHQQQQSTKTTTTAKTTTTTTTMAIHLYETCYNYILFIYENHPEDWETKQKQKQKKPKNQNHNESTLFTVLNKEQDTKFCLPGLPRCDKSSLSRTI